MCTCDGVAGGEGMHKKKKRSHSKSLLPTRAPVSSLPTDNCPQPRTCTNSAHPHSGSGRDAQHRKKADPPKSHGGKGERGGHVPPNSKDQRQPEIRSRAQEDRRQRVAGEQQARKGSSRSR
ncbi:Hypothetical predicted protein [Pelobates cultripes]|uniref:Uncharacterized protein n=1 Tax=Pelobates cultripes TaxID=61616 RepID=A0AAD1T4G0_PELCU|nr:Hypothetical predicted protein [Pelobates cultripes]